ncbi:IclR family transcriptional regulator [Caballeronia sp. J97]|uniref:IclR family transcriptional regulator n=1 Tax=Caballeronia sp. J97 TaxID=2805429 RepID=UPI002AB29CCF|nr:IclR family transcriptional regulator [Caballeronia sp. J97]
MSQTPANPKNAVLSVVKAFAVLRAFVPGNDQLTISEIATRTDLDRGTAFRLVHTLRELGYITPVSGTKRFRLTLKCLELGYTALAHLNLKDLSRPIVAELVAQGADAASLGMLDGTDVVFVERAQATFGRNLDRNVGSRIGIYASALGQAILAFEPPDYQREVLERSDRRRLSERTITDVDELLKKLSEIRARGWAASDGENAFGLRTIAAPVFNKAGEAVAAISVTNQAGDTTMESFIEEALPHLLAAVAELSQAACLGEPS